MNKILNLLLAAILIAGASAMAGAVAAVPDFADVVDRPWFLWVFRITGFAAVVSVVQLIWRIIRSARN